MSGDNPIPGDEPAQAGMSKRAKWLWVVMIGSFAVFLILAAVASKYVDMGIAHRWIAAQNSALVILFMAVLPVFGFPASVTFVVGGAKFGSGAGLLVTALTIGIHLLATYWICHSFLRRPIEAFFRRRNFPMPQIPPGEYVSIVLLVALVPGLPYAAKNYLLVLGGVPWRPYFWVAWPAHLFHASLGIFFGDFTANLTPPRIAFLVGYALLLAWLSRRVVRRLRTQSRVAQELAPEV